GRPPDPADPIEPAVDAVVAAEGFDAVDGGGGHLDDAQRLGLAAQCREGAELGPGGQQHARIPAAGAAAENVAVDDDDVQIRLLLFQPNGGPHAEKAAADDADVGGGFAIQRRRQGG